MTRPLPHQKRSTSTSIRRQRGRGLGGRVAPPTMACRVRRREHGRPILASARCKNPQPVRQLRLTVLEHGPGKGTALGTRTLPHPLFQPQRPRICESASCVKLPETQGWNTAHAGSGRVRRASFFWQSRSSSAPAQGDNRTGPVHAEAADRPATVGGCGGQSGGFVCGAQVT